MAWKVAAAAAAGSSHERLNLPCQDALGYQILHSDSERDGILVAALADGAGSAQRSEQGARTAVDTALQFLTAYLQEEGLPQQEGAWSLLLDEAFTAAQLALYQLADEEDLPVRSYATTLSCLVAHAGGYALATLGDGVVVSLDAAGDLALVNRLQRGEYANETYFLTQDFALEQVQTVICSQPAQGIVMMSDGLARLALSFPSQKPFEPFFRPLFAFIESREQGVTAEDSEANLQLEAFLNSDRVRARTDDDKSLLIAVQGPENQTKQEENPHFETLGAGEQVDHS
ncbi:MAG: protein phosphatase 2C domain-containing protein [Chloroflexi bacterium]|nr:protein phosphatase 2C domain-containing protein [Chloroflexota bacterium]